MADFTPNASAGASTSPPASPGPETLSPLEQEVLDEYARLAGNLNDLSALLSTLSQNPSAGILDALRGLERKTSLVFTLLKASVYSIVLQQQIYGEDEGGEGEGLEGGMGEGESMDVDVDVE
ncbi:uncharacterized protein K452DRAFT_221346 [Aplosporella prunicola CBS 121167]|uniref:DASH complex subunit DAD3 n=1 Tax=Aplosporella prunicola CBS 121167 TaxID=1176127 RepID=A0A6A6BQV8_9PEZI|nr:uncharacterized protein K452DRAFT_221346 [Aplosporella prunicola CBS 121167]KAF2145813.1 hypothetical protein K452DRAFT_221346 [Aplosporella prunicola CBS 121167]